MEEYWKQKAQKRLSWLVVTSTAFFCVMTYALFISISAFYIIFTKVVIN